MVKKYFSFLLILTFCTCFLSCSDDNYVQNPDPDPELVSPVVFNLSEVPYQNLSEYNFFNEELKNLDPVYGVLPYDLNSSLFTDYAKKKRFIWMPQDTKASYVNDFSPLDFPVGAVLIKNFYYENVLPDGQTKILETRLMYRKEDGWDFAKYVWNDTQTEAVFTEEGSDVAISWEENDQTKNVNYHIPAKVECFTCHNKFGTPVPIGPKPQNLNRSYNYTDGNKNQLSKWEEYGYLDANYPATIISTADWKDANLPLDLRARSYVDINCAHCHSEESYCEYRPMRFAFNTNDDLINMGVCVEPDTNIDNSLTHIIAPNDINASVVFFRINSTEEQYRMPLIGRTLQHKEGIRLIEDWINSLTNQCE